MGNVRLGAPADLIVALRDAFGVEDFIETGTYLGATALWAASQFRHVVTIEVSPQLYQRLAPQHSIPNARFILGDSREELPAIVAGLSRPAIFWLDGHWSAGITAGKGDECPVLEEIRIILASPLDHLLLIDDARLFETPPPPPHDPKQWPTTKEVFHTLTQPRKAGYSSGYLATIEDVIVSVPLAASQMVEDYCRNRITQALR